MKKNLKIKTCHCGDDAGLHLRHHRLPDLVAQLKANVAKNIRLGLDLKGGSHLVLQVQVQDAAKAEPTR